jgi:hypothetical protein
LGGLKIAQLYVVGDVLQTTYRLRIDTWALELHLPTMQSIPQSGCRQRRVGPSSRFRSADRTGYARNPG